MTKNIITSCSALHVQEDILLLQYYHDLQRNVGVFSQFCLPYRAALVHWTKPTEQHQQTVSSQHSEVETTICW